MQPPEPNMSHVNPVLVTGGEIGDSPFFVFVYVLKWTLPKKVEWLILVLFRLCCCKNINTVLSLNCKTIKSMGSLWRWPFILDRFFTTVTRTGFTDIIYALDEDNLYKKKQPKKSMYYHSCMHCHCMFFLFLSVENSFFRLFS